MKLLCTFGIDYAAFFISRLHTTYQNTLRVVEHETVQAFAVSGAKLV